MTDRWQSFGFHPWLARQYGPCDIMAKSWKGLTAKGTCRQQCDGTESAGSTWLHNKAQEAATGPSGVKALLLRAAGVPVR
jgi:hypothetical protein